METSNLSGSCRGFRFILCPPKTCPSFCLDGPLIFFLVLLSLVFLATAIKVDKENMDYNKLRVKQLKGILADRGVDCDGCLEKSDYVARCKATEHLEL